MMAFRWPKFSRASAILLGLLAALVVGMLLFDWNWFRRPLERYLIDRSHREVRIGELHVDLGFSLEPTVRLRDVYVENAPWADKRPFAVAGEASFTFSLKSVWEGRPVISRLVLVDADVDLERQADGLRNWRLRNPDDRGPGKVKVLRLEPQRTRIRFVRRDIDLDVAAAASPAESAANGRPPGASLPTRIDFEGKTEGAEFSGSVLTGRLLTFLETGDSFPIRGHVSAGKTRLDVDGTLADLFLPSAVDGKMRVSGPSLSKLHPFLRVDLPVSRPYEFAARVRRQKDAITFSDVRGKIGTSDVAGELDVDTGKERTTLRAALRSESADLWDLGSLVGIDHAADKAPKRLFSTHTINREGLQELDLHVTVHAAKLKAAEAPALESLRLTADLSNGVLALKPIDIGLAGGHLRGQASLDARQKPLSSHVVLDLSGVRLERLLASLADGARSAGPLKGHFDLKGRGESVAQMFASAAGSIKLSMAGGGISNLLDAKLGLNLGKVIRLSITGDRTIGINEAVAEFRFDKGRGTSKVIAFDTDQTHTEGSGVIDLRNETVDVLLTPQLKKPALLALRSSIRVQGPLRQPQVSVAGFQGGRGNERLAGSDRRDPADPQRAAGH